MAVESRSESTPEVTKASTPQQAAAPVVDEKALVAEVDQKFTNWRSMKRPHEVQWFVNAASTRGLTNVRWNDYTTRLETAKIPNYKNNPSINKILPKFRARKSKFLKTRYTPVVIPASSDKEDKLNAVASQKALEYASRKHSLENVYRRALNWALQCGKAFIWIYWDDNALAMMKDPMTGQVIEAPLGDVGFDAGSPFEVLVPDMGVENIGLQHEIMRVRAIPLEELKLRYSKVPGIENLKGDTNSEDLFQYQKQIATLSARTNVGYAGGMNDKSDRDLNFVIRKELFTRPCGKYPQGRYVVTAGGMVLKAQNVLPYGFASNPTNPYPVIEITDIELPGQFWPTSIVEQLLGPQREYDDYRQKLRNHLAKQTHPKVIASVFNKWAANAWNDEAGEVIRIVTPPGVPPPTIWTPPPISGDIWQAMQLNRVEMDEISTIPPTTQGDAGRTTSGFQVNLLQEANDAINAPDVRGHELAFEELYKKTRQIMAKGYQTPRLIAIAGRAHIPDVQEFSTNNIDENAEIIVYTGSSLASSPAIRTQQVIELWNSGLLVDDMNPAEGKRRALTMLDANGIGEFQEEKRRDEEKARLENLNIGKQQFVNPPLIFDDHQIHYNIHTDQMKSPEFEMWDETKQKELFVHTLLHMKFINPMTAINTAAELGIPEIIPMLMPAPLPAVNQPPAVGGVEAPVEEAPPAAAPPPPEQSY